MAHFDVPFADSPRSALAALEAAGGLLGLLDVLVAGASELPGAAVEMAFNFAVCFCLAPAAFAFIIHSTSGGCLH
jgi:hypothetical protein